MRSLIDLSEQESYEPKLRMEKLSSTEYLLTFASSYAHYLGLQPLESLGLALAAQDSLSKEHSCYQQLTSGKPPIPIVSLSLWPQLRMGLFVF